MPPVLELGEHWTSWPLFEK